jgi:hypothetical protein
MLACAVLLGGQKADAADPIVTPTEINTCSNSSKIPFGAQRAPAADSGSGSIICPCSSFPALAPDAASTTAVRARTAITALETLI